MKTHFFVLKKGQEVADGILDFCKKREIKSAYFSAIGAVSEAEIAFYDIQKKEYSFKKYEEDLEINSITGNVAVFKNKPMIHAHGTFSDKNMKTIGGHLKSAIVSGTCETFLAELNETLVRSYDSNTGLNLIKPL